MKAIKSIFIVSFLFMGCVLFAQPPGGGRGGQQGPPPSQKQIEKMVNELAKEISLTDNQKTKVLEQYVDHFDEVKEKTSGNSRPDRSEMEALKASFENKVKAILSDEQKKGFEAYQKKQSSHNPRR